MRSIAYTLVALAAVASFHAVTARPMPESPGASVVQPAVPAIIVSDRSAYLRVEGDSDGATGAFDVSILPRSETILESMFVKLAVAGEADTFQLQESRTKLCATRDKQNLVFRACDEKDKNQQWQIIHQSSAANADDTKDGFASDKNKEHDSDKKNKDDDDSDKKNKGDGSDKKNKNDGDDDDDDDDSDKKNKGDGSDKKNKNDDGDDDDDSDKNKDDGSDKTGETTGDQPGTANEGFVFRLKGSGKSETDGVCWESSDKKLIVADCRLDNAKQFFDIAITNSP